jgi:hypothetical protein
MALIKCGQKGSSFVTTRGETYSVSDVTSLLKLLASLNLRTEIVRRASNHYVKMKEGLPGNPRRKRGRPRKSDLQALYPEIAITIRTTYSSLDKALATIDSKKAFWERGRTCEACLENPSSTAWRVYGYTKYPQHRDTAGNLLFLCQSCCHTLSYRVKRSSSSFSEIVGHVMRFGTSQEYLERLFKPLIDIEEPTYWETKSGHLRSLKAAGQLAKFYPGAPIDRTSLNTAFFREDSTPEPEFKEAETVIADSAQTAEET